MDSDMEYKQKRIHEEQLAVAIFNRFSCTAGDCPYTCCRDWNTIGIDDVALQRYRQEKDIMAGVDEKRKRFLYSEKYICYFLSQQGLCNLILQHGEESLCKTCRSFPRIQMQRGDVTERSLSNGCPEVLRLLDAEKEPLSFVYSAEAFPEGYETDKGILVRNCMIDLLQLRDIPLYIRCQMLYLFSERYGKGGMQTVASFSDACFLFALTEHVAGMPCDTRKLMGVLHVIFNAFAEKCREYQPYDKYISPYESMSLDIEQEQFDAVMRRYHVFLERYGLLLEEIAVQFAFRQFYEADAAKLTGQVVALMIQLSMTAYTAFLNLLSQEELTDTDVYVICAFYARGVEQNRDSMLQLIKDLQAEPKLQDGSLQFLTHILR